ncbi:MAG: hypothetical protein ACPGU1_05700 [Myxococcota bacterium]
MSRYLLLMLCLSAWIGCGDRQLLTPPHLESECWECQEEDAQLCLDGVDSDEDGLTDCDDPDCAWVAGCPWEGLENTDQRCGDGLDNDGNGFTDCKDWSCKLTAACCPGGPQEENTNEACSNGIDDDCNGYIDCVDFACDDICL